MKRRFLSAIRKYCCCKAGDTEPLVGDESVDEFKPAAIAVQPKPTDAVVFVPASDVSAAAKKGHNRTPSVPSVPVPLAITPIVPATNPPTPKASQVVVAGHWSRPSSPASSDQSSECGQTVIERAPRREDSKESVVTARERTPPPKPSRKGDEESKAASQDSKPSQESEASKKGTSDSHELPEGVTSLNEVKNLKELINDDKYDLKHPFWNKISLFLGDITKIQVDAIVNAANDRLGGGGGVDGAIHSAAGYDQLQAECRKHTRPVPTGEAVVTESCKLSTHVKKIIHCVGPVCYGGVTDEKRKKLESCYRRAIQLSEENGLRSIAFCCISTGIYGYDNKDAAKTVLRFLWNHFNKKESAEKWDRVVLCLFMDIDKQSYLYYIKELLADPSFFDDGEKEESEDEEKKTKEDEKKSETENGETEEKNHEEKDEK